MNEEFGPGTIADDTRMVKEKIVKDFTQKIEEKYAENLRVSRIATNSYLLPSPPYKPVINLVLSAKTTYLRTYFLAVSGAKTTYLPPNHIKKIFCVASQNSPTYLLAAPVLGRDIDGMR